MTCYNGMRFGGAGDNGRMSVVHSPHDAKDVLGPFLCCTVLRRNDVLPRALLPSVPVGVGNFTPRGFDRRFRKTIPTSRTLTHSLGVPAMAVLRHCNIPGFCGFLGRAKVDALAHPTSRCKLSLVLKNTRNAL